MIFMAFWFSSSLHVHFNSGCGWAFITTPCGCLTETMRSLICNYAAHFINSRSFAPRINKCECVQASELFRNYPFLMNAIKKNPTACFFVNVHIYASVSLGIHFLSSAGSSRLATNICRGQQWTLEWARHISHTCVGTWSRVARWHIFYPKIQIWVNFRVCCNGRCWFIIWPFGKFSGHLVYFSPFWYSFTRFWYSFIPVFGML
jgi:hypothetical protein